VYPGAIEIPVLLPSNAANRLDRTRVDRVIKSSTFPSFSLSHSAATFKTFVMFRKSKPAIRLDFWKTGYDRAEALAERFTGKSFANG
jgi:hypothetical protein